MTDHTETRCRDCDGYNCDNGCSYPPKDTEMQIPDDVMEAAKEAHANFARSSVTDNLTVIIARAILAERERCARIAEAEWVWPNTAAAIRGSVDK